MLSSDEHEKNKRKKPRVNCQSMTLTYGFREKQRNLDAQDQRCIFNTTSICMQAHTLKAHAVRRRLDCADFVLIKQKARKGTRA